MRRGIVMIGAALLLATAGVSGAEVNCKQVNKYLQTGRSVTDVAETMVIGEDDVKKCQEAAAAAPRRRGEGREACGLRHQGDEVAPTDRRAVVGPPADHLRGRPDRPARQTGPASVADRRWMARRCARRGGRLTAARCRSGRWSCSAIGCWRAPATRASPATIRPATPRSSRCARRRRRPATIVCPARSST